MALAEDRRLADGAYHRRKSGGRSHAKGKQAPPFDASTLRVAAWAGAVLAPIGLLGLIYAPSLLVIWIALLVFAVAAVPQTLFATRRGQRREREGRGH